jgi:small subunit ribosomal protein S15
MAEKKTKTPKKVEKKVSNVVGELLFQRHEKDTGSPEVQVGLLSQNIDHLQSHLNAHKKDFDAKRSLLKKVAKRRKFLKYLKDTKLDNYATVSKKLDLKV